MAEKSSGPVLATPYSGDNSVGALARAYALANPTPAPSVTADISSMVDPRKVYLARQEGVTDGLNDIEKDFATKDADENALKYGNQAYGIDTSIMQTAAGDFAKSQRTRSIPRAVGDTAIGVLNGAAQGVLGVADMANKFATPWALADRLTGTRMTNAVTGLINQAAQGINSLAEQGYSDEVTQNNLIKGYKNAQDEAVHQREYEEAIAGGDSPLMASMSRVAKDFGSGFANAMSGSTSWTQMPADLVGSLLAMSAVGKAASLAGAGAKVLAGIGKSAVTGAERVAAGAGESALTRAGAEAAASTAERAGVVGTERAAETAAPVVAGTTAERAGAEAIADTISNTAERAAGVTAENTAEKSWLAKAKDFLEEPTQVALQEGGSAGLDSYNEVMEMSDEDLTKKSEMYREIKAKYLAQGLSEEEAQTKAKDDIAYSASNRAAIYTGLMAAPVGKLMPKGIIKNPIKVLANPASLASNTLREGFEEAGENSDAIGSNLAKKQTYDNDTDILEGVGTGMGEGMASAATGTFEMGAPRAALRMAHKGLQKGSEKLFGEEGSPKNIARRQRANIKTLDNEKASLAAAKASIKAQGEAGDAETNEVADSINEVAGSVTSAQTASDTIDKMSNLTSATFDNENDVNEYNAAFGDEKPHIKVGDNKFKAMEDYASELSSGLKELEKVGINSDPETAVDIFNKVKYFDKLRNNLFGDGDLETVLDHVSEEHKEAVTKAYNAFDSMRKNTVYSDVLAHTNKFAEDLIANQEKLLNNKSLTDEQRKASARTLLNAYTHSLEHTFMSADKLDQAQAFAEEAQKNGLLDSEATTSFLKEVGKKKNFQNRYKTAQQNRAKVIKEVAREMGENLTDEQVNSLMSGKDINSVKFQKLNGIYTDGSPKKSLNSVKNEVAQLMREGKETEAKQSLLGYMHFVQSQINKLNAYKQSHAKWLKDHQTDGAGTKTKADAVNYVSYNPNKRTKYTSQKGIYAGHPILGYALAKESEALVEEFNLLKDQFFADDNELTLKNADPNSGAVTNQDLINHYTGWKGYQAQRIYAEHNKKTKSSDNTTSNTGSNSSTESEVKDKKDSSAKTKTEGKPQKTESSNKEKEDVFDPFGSDYDYVMSRIQQETGSAAYDNTGKTQLKEWQTPEQKDLSKKKGTLTDKGMEHLTPYTEAERNKPKSRTYAVSGLKAIPDTVKAKFKRIAAFLEKNGITVRVNSNDGIGGIARSGLSDPNDHSQWMTTGSVINNYWASTNERARTIANELMPGLSEAELNKVAACVYQVLGTDLDTPVDFVIAYSPKNTPNNDAIVIQLAEKLNIPVFNLAEGNPEEVFNQYTDWYTNQYSQEKAVQDKRADIINSAIDNTLKTLESEGIPTSNINKKALNTLFRNLDPKNESYSQDEIADAVHSLGSKLGNLDAATEAQVALAVKEEFDKIQQQVLQEEADAEAKEIASTIRPDKIASEVADTVHQVKNEFTNQFKIGRGNKLYKALRTSLDGVKYAEATVNKIKEKIADLGLSSEITNRIAEILSEKLLAQSPEAKAKLAEEQKKAEEQAKIKQEVDNKTTRFNNAKKNLVGLSNNKFGSVDDFRTKLKPIAESNQDAPNQITSHDAKLLQEVTDFNNKNSLVSKLKNTITTLCSSNKQLKAKKLYSDKKGVISLWADNKDTPTYLNPAKGSPFYKETKDKDDNIVKKTTVTYDEVMDVLNDKEKSSQVSQEEFQRLCELFPTLLLMKYNDETNQLEVDNDLVANMAVNAIALFNNQKEGTGYEWERIAQDLGTSVSQLLSIYDKNGNSIGARFLQNATSGMMKKPLYEGLSRTLKKSLGIKFNPNMTEAAAQLTVQTLSQVLLDGLAQADFIDAETFPVGNNITVYCINENHGQILSEISDPKALNTMLGNDRALEEGAIFAEGNEPTAQQIAQENSERNNNYLHSSIPLSRSDKEARDVYEQVNYRIDEGMSEIYHSLAQNDDIVSLYGEDVSDPDNMDPTDRISKESYNRLLENAFSRFTRWEDAMRAAANAAGKPLAKVYKRFKIAFTSVDRFQELESYGPIANKLVREVLLSTWNTVNISDKNGKDWSQLGAAVLQNFGGKLNNTPSELINNAFNALVDEISSNTDKYKALLKMVAKPSELSKQDVLDAQKALAAFMASNEAFNKINLKKVDQNFMGLHAMQTLAQAVQAQKEGKSTLETSIYVECDGTTNGTIFGRFLLTQRIDKYVDESNSLKDNGAEFIETLDHGNLRIGDTFGAPAGEVKYNVTDSNGNPAPKDIYEKSAKKVAAKVTARAEELTNPDNFESNNKTYAEYYAEHPHTQENRVVVTRGGSTQTGIQNKKGKNKKGNKNTHQEVQSNFVQVTEPVTPKDYYNAVDILFRVTGLTKNIFTSLSEEVTRSFMKSPDTKGGYSAGKRSIINSFLHGDRNVPGILNVLHEYRTKVMRAEAALGVDEVLSEQQIANAMFGDKGLSDAQNLELLHDYTRALNIVTQNKLITTVDEDTGATTYKCLPTYAKGNTANTMEVLDRDESGESIVTGYTHKNFSASSFCHSFHEDVASINLSADNQECLYQAVMEVYGNDIVDAVNETLKGEGITPTNDAITEHTEIVTVVNNVLQASRIDKFDPNFDTVQDANNTLRVFNKVGTPTSNTISYDDGVTPIGYVEGTTVNDMSGGSINNAEDFGRYSKSYSNSRFATDEDKSTSALKYDQIEKPGVRQVPTHTQHNGDAHMVKRTCRKGGTLEKLDKKGTPIYDGFNSGVGQVDQASHDVNEDMFETGMRNTVEPLAQDAYERGEYLREQVSGKDGESSDTYHAAEMMAEAINYVANPDGKTTKLPLDTLIGAFVTLFNKVHKDPNYSSEEVQAARIKAVKQFLQKCQEEITPRGKHGYVDPAYNLHDFLIQNFDPKVIRAAVKKQVFQRIMAKYETSMVNIGAARSKKAAQIRAQRTAGKDKTSTTEGKTSNKKFSKFSIISSENYKHYNLTPAFFKVMQNVEGCPHSEAEWKQLEQQEYARVLSYFIGSVHTTAKGEAVYQPEVMNASSVTTEQALSLITESMESSYETLSSQAQSVSRIHAAVYCMGATCDHMASGNNPYVLDPRREGQSGFISMLRQLHLKPKKGLDEHTLFNMYLNSKPRHQLDVLQSIYANSRDFVNNPRSKKVRAEILRGFEQFIIDNTEYELPTDQARHQAALEDARVKALESSRNVKTTTVAKYFETANSETNSIKHALQEFSNIFEQDHQNKRGTGVNKNTKIVTINGYENKQTENTPAKARENARELLITKYKQDMKAVGQEPNPAVERYISGKVANADTIAAEQNINDRNYVGVQFYEPATDTIYCLSPNPSGALSIEQSNLLHEVRLPHEIMHSIADRCLAHFETEYNNNYRAYKAGKNKAWWNKLSKKEKLALQALDRMHQLKDLIDSTLAANVDLEELAETNPTIKFYLENREQDNANGKGMQEFVAYFGSLSDSQVTALTDAIIARKGATTLNTLAKDTRKDISLLQKVLSSFKKLYQQFVGLIFNKKPESDTVRDIVLNNLSILSAVHNDSNLDANGIWQENLSQTSQTTSFLNEVQDNGLDPNNDVNAEVATSELSTRPEPTLNSVEQLANSLTNTVKAKLKALKTAQKNSFKNGTLQQITDRWVAHLDKLQQMEAEALQIANGDNIVNNIITPLENFGFNVGNHESFYKIVGSLSLLRDIKSPIFADVNLGVKKILDNLSPESFCEDPTDQAELDRGARIVTFLQGMSENGLNASEIAPVMLALSQTDPEFRQILANIKFPQRDTEGYLAADKFLNKVANKAVNVISHLKHEKPNTNFANAFDNLVLRMIKDEGAVAREAIADTLVTRVENALTGTVAALIDRAGAKLGKKLDVAESIFSQNGMTVLENRLNKTNAPHALKEFIHDMIGCTEQNQEFYMANSRVKVAAQQSRENARTQLPKVTKKRFKTKLTDKQWSKFSKTIGKSGLATLFNNDTNALANLLSSPKQISAEITSLAQQLGDKYQIAKCRQLASYMMTGKAGKMLLRNPLAIAMKLGTKGKKEATAEEIALCDKLTSLFALEKYVSQNDRNELAELLRNDPDAMKTLLNTAKNQYQKGMEKASGYNRGKFNWYKAPLASDFKNGAHFKIAPLSRKNEMERFGYKLERKYSGSNLDGVEMGVYYANFSQTNYLNPGAIQLTSATGNGINLATGSSLHPNGGMIVDLKTVNKITAQMGNYYAHEGEDLMPVFDSDGNIIAYERSIDPTLLNDNKYLKPTADYAELLGIQEGRNTEEELIETFNNEVVDIIYDRYRKDKSNGKGSDYVDLFSVKDPVVKNLVDRIPSNLRTYIEEKFGEDGKFMVLPSEINDIIGYHSASITDSWTGESRLPPAVQNAFVAICEKMMGKNAFKYLKKSEDNWHNVITSAKDMIIIRSAVVPAMNMFANMLQLYIEGVPVTTILTGSMKVAKELNQYTKLQTQLLQVEQELKGETLGYRLKQLEAQKKVIQSAIDHLSIADLLKQKEFSSIANVGNIDRMIDFTDGHLGDQILSLVDKHTKSELFKSAAHYGFLSPDTTLYKFLEKTNQYGDFIGKAILYQDLIERRGWTPKQAQLKIKDEFVDYARLPGRGRDYMERMGLLWFYNFKLRMQKVAFANLKEHPLRCLALSAMGMPTPMTDSLFGKFPVLSYTMGPTSMLKSAFTSNPWVALLGLLF